MKIAILSDIHGNNFALKSVLKEIDKEKVDKILILGDFVGYYYNIDFVLDLLDSYDKEIIKGNHEILMEKSIKSNKKSLDIQNKYGSGIEISKKKLRRKQIDNLINLPEKKQIEIDGLKIFICHGSPWDVSEYIYPDSSEVKKRKCLENDSDFVFIGHSHYPFIYESDNKTLINVGSVGQNRKVGGIANWVYLDTKKSKYIIKETTYDTKPLIEQIKKIDPEKKYLIDVLNRKKE